MHSELTVHKMSDIYVCCCVVLCSVAGTDSRVSCPMTEPQSDRSWRRRNSNEEVPDNGATVS